MVYGDLIIDLTYIFIVIGFGPIGHGIIRIITFMVGIIGIDRGDTIIGIIVGIMVHGIIQVIM